MSCSPPRKALLPARDGPRRNAAAGPASAGRGLTTAELGSLDWPVEGRILFRFGRDTLPSGAVIRRNGIRIAEPAGTPVQAVSSGRVALVQRLGTYGLTVALGRSEERRVVK